MAAAPLRRLRRDMRLFEASQMKPLSSLLMDFPLFP
jgi:hypothetical protein